MDLNLFEEVHFRLKTAMNYDTVKQQSSANMFKKLKKRLSFYISSASHVFATSEIFSGKHLREKSVYVLGLFGW